MTTLDDLIARLEKAEGPDRVLDLAISFAINYRSAFDEAVRAVWSPMADDIEVFDAQGRRGFLDPAQFVPLWTRSIDVALTLVPKGMRWTVTGAWRGYKDRAAVVGDDAAMKPACLHEAATPVLALLTAIFNALKARQTTINGEG